MTLTHQNCTTPDQLLALLRGGLSSDDETQLQMHLDECTFCRERLETAAADVTSWNEAGRFLRREAVHEVIEDSGCDREEVTQWSARIRQVLDSLAPTDDPESLGRIGGYEVTGVVGAGGMGVVLKAHDRSLDRIVAIKVMAIHLASSGSARRRFAREAKAAAAVLHPNVIAIHSVASTDDCPYLVMPYVRGASLQKRINSQGPLPLKDTLRIGSQIAAGLAAAHGQGLVHRDIKPANILLEEGVERVTITDFGLARAVDDASMTCSGVIAGTPQYMSPEQIRGESIDARSDLFSLGSVLYAMCTGRSPFRAETTYGVLHRIANDSPTPVCEVNSDVPIWLGRVIERLMARRPADRFESATQVAELLEGCLAHVQQPTAISLPASVVALENSQRSGSGIPPVGLMTRLWKTVTEYFDRPEAKSSTNMDKRPQSNGIRRPPIARLMAASAFAFVLILAGVVVVLELNKGTLTIESELENVPIRIIQGDKVVDRLTVTRSGNSVRVAAGTYVVELDTELDGMTIENDQVLLKRGSTELVRIRHSTTEGNSTVAAARNRFETPEALMKYAADCQNSDDTAGFMACWTDEPVRQFATSYLVMSVMMLQEFENDPSSFNAPGYDEQRAELGRILSEEIKDKDAAISVSALTLAHKEIADKAMNDLEKTAKATVESPLVQMLATLTVDHLKDPRRFVARINALHDKFQEPDEEQDQHVFNYTVEQDGDKGVATDTTRGNKFGLIKTETGWRINDLWYGLKSQEAPAETAESTEQRPELLQGVWEYTSVESDGVITEYTTLKSQTSSFQLTIQGDRWMVNAGIGSGGHRVKIEGNQLTFYGMTSPNGMTSSLPGLNNNTEVPTIGYGLFRLEGDSLVYLMTPTHVMTPGMPGDDATGQSEMPIRMPETFETRGTQNNVFRLRRVRANEAQGDGLNSANRVPPPTSSPEFPPVRIVVHDEEGRPLEGVQVSLFQVPTKEDGKIVEIGETSDAQGLAVNRRLPFGHYEISARTMDGWYLPGHGSRINVEFEKGFDLTLVAPAPRRVGKLIIGSDLGIRSTLISELRFGELQETHGIGYSVGYAPEPEADRPDSDTQAGNAVSPSGFASSRNGNYESFPTVANGIEQVGAEIRLEISRTIQQPALTSSQHVNTEWQWSPGNTTTFSHRYLIVEGTARGVEDGVSQGKSLDRNPAEGSEFFRFSSANHRVGGALLSLSEPWELPLELDIPTGKVRVFVERFLGRPNDVVLRSLSWRSQGNQPELWLHANIRRQSAWIERIIDTTGWTYSVPGEDGSTISGHLLQREHSLQPGEIFELWPKTNHVEAARVSSFEARTLDEVTSVFNEETRKLRMELFHPAIPDLTPEQLKSAMLDSAAAYRSQGKLGIPFALESSVNANRLVEELKFVPMTGATSENFRQIMPSMQYEDSLRNATVVVLPKAEIRYSRDGWSSPAWGEIHPPVTGT
ncbi:MAG: protein kinase [Planctomyces sp.]|nr:protein kinase [Planctomyces sp.]